LFSSRIREGIARLLSRSGTADLEERPGSGRVDSASRSSRRPAGTGQGSSGGPAGTEPAQPLPRRAPERAEAGSGERASEPGVSFLAQDELGGAPPGRGDLATTPVGVDEYLPGDEVITESGPVFIHECLLSAFKEDARELRRKYRRVEEGEASRGWDGAGPLAALLGGAVRGALFLDLETTGLYGSPLFLAGFLIPVADDFVIRQLFARDYSEERALLLEAQRTFAQCSSLVTFNGKSYDVPFIRERAAYHRMDLPPLDGKPHLDLLHWCRRRWKGDVSNCKLKTLEWEICRQRRWGDVPGDAIPGIYHRYVRTGDPYQLVPVFHHNVLDLVTMVELLVRLLD
jgi:uncharacterized protein YprB with RNaseH-like and TPR domain